MISCGDWVLYSIPSRARLGIFACRYRGFSWVIIPDDDRYLIGQENLESWKRLCLKPKKSTRPLPNNLEDSKYLKRLGPLRDMIMTDLYPREVIQKLAVDRRKYGLANLISNRPVKKIDDLTWLACMLQSE